MYIKQIIIQGFKSYKDQTVIEPFSPKHNVIVGRNGSGKSNFFAAIRFVLSDAYTQMGREERGALLHEGAGSAVMSAYVEIIFDNADKRFPTDTEDVVLRRTIGQKKDEYSLNKKNVTKNEVMSLLENAGFSRSNPYYIVPQGRVTALTNMKDVDRLILLKEVAGTQVYEARRTESLKSMADSENRNSKIDQQLDHMRGRLGELEEEKEELRAYQDQDRERRCLEYAIHHREQEALQEKLDELEEHREGGADRNDEDREALDAQQDQLDANDAELAELQQQIRLLSDERTQLEEERKETTQEKARIELDVNALTDGQSSAQQARQQHASDLHEVQGQITLREAELAQIMPEYDVRKEEEKQVKQQLTEAEGTRQRLYAKQGRQSQFKTKKERDAWLRKEVDEVNMALATRKAVTMQTTEDISELEMEIGQIDEQTVDMRSHIENRGDEQQNFASGVQKAKDERDRLMDQRKELWREEAKLDSVLSNAQAELEKAERFLATMMDQNTSRGLAAVRRIVKQQSIQGAYGTLGELCEFTDKYKTAVEVTAGTSLFHYVVDTDATATRLLEMLQKEKAGRVTFMPLNRLKPKPGNLPKASDAVHLVTKLKYDQAYDKAFQQVFGKTIVCPNLQVAAQYARSHGVSAITPEGDRSDKKGALTGGYHDTKRSRVDGLRRTSHWREQYDQSIARKSEIRDEQRALDQRVTKAMSELQKLEQRRVQTEGAYGPLRVQLRAREAEALRKRDELDAKTRSRDNVETNVRSLSEQLSGYESELASAFSKALSNEEERQLTELGSRVTELRKQYGDLSSMRSELEGHKSSIEIELRENLRLRLDQLQSLDVEAGASQGTGQVSSRLKERQKELKRISKALQELTANLAENETAIEEAKNELQDKQNSRAEAQKQVDDLARQIRHHAKSVEKATAKRAALSASLLDATQAVRNLGAVPDAASSETYTKMTSDAAIKRLGKVRHVLKGYGHVNKKAFEQFAQFERQVEELANRRRELDTGDEAIRGLIEHLDQQKDEAIERTFRQVSREFARVFERLVPAGKGRLVIQRRSDKQARQQQQQQQQGDEEDSEEQGQGVESYTGVGISVSFNSKHDEQQRIQQLSGGQKSLCALALVFSIQASDPAPFYLFDEIDANLDAQYRSAVAQLLQASSATGQFICTTFRPEMLLVAEKCYGVSYIGKASSIDVVSREQALGFVEGQIGGGGK